MITGTTSAPVAYRSENMQADQVFDPPRLSQNSSASHGETIEKAYQRADDLTNAARTVSDIMKDLGNLPLAGGQGGMGEAQVDAVHTLLGDVSDELNARADRFRSLTNEFNTIDAARNEPGWPVIGGATNVIRDQRMNYIAGVIERELETQTVQGAFAAVLNERLSGITNRAQRELFSSAAQFVWNSITNGLFNR